MNTLDLINEMAQADLTAKVIDYIKNGEIAKAADTYKGKPAGISRTLKTFIANNKDFKSGDLLNNIIAFGKEVNPNFGQDQAKAIKDSIGQPIEKKERKKPSEPVDVKNIDALYEKAKEFLTAFKTLKDKKVFQLQQIKDNTSKGHALVQKDTDAKNTIQKDLDKYNDIINKLKSFISINKDKYKEENFADLSAEEKRKVMENLKAAKEIVSKMQKPKVTSKKGANLKKTEETREMLKKERQTLKALQNKIDDPDSIDKSTINKLKSIANTVVKDLELEAKTKRSKADQEDINTLKNLINKTNPDPAEVQDAYDVLDDITKAGSKIFNIQEAKRMSAKKEVLSILRKI